MKKLIYKLLPYIIFLVAYSFITFLLVKDYTTVFIMSYMFIVLSMMIHIVNLVIIEKKIKSMVTLAPMYFITFAYLCVSVILNTVFIALYKLIHYNVAIIGNVIVIALFSIYFILHFRNATQIKNNEKETSKQLLFVRAASSNIQQLMSNIKEKEKLNIVESLYDAVRNSEAVGVEGLEDIETDIMDDIIVLEKYLNNSDMSADEIKNLCERIKGKITKRNAKIKMNKYEV